jgi:hypothetical protein
MLTLFHGKSFNQNLGWDPGDLESNATKGGKQLASLFHKGAVSI